MDLIKRSRNTYIVLCLIIFAALALRGAFFAYKLYDFKLYGDSKNYINMSHQLVDKGIYGYWYEGSEYGPKPGVPNARVTPAFPLFLSGIYAAVHDTYKQITIVRLMHVFIGGFITPLLAFALAGRLFKRKGAALVTAFLVAIYPSYVLSTTQILTEVIALASMILYLYLLVIGFEGRKGYANLLAGAAFAVQIYIRPTMLPLYVVPFIYAWFTWFRNSRRELLKIFIYNTAGFVILMLPWWIRNYLVLGNIILTADAAGNPLLSGTYPYMKDVLSDVPESIRGNSQLQTEFAKERIIRGFTAEPLLYFKWYTIGKLQYLFNLPWMPGVSTRRAAYLLVHYYTLAFGVLGMIFNWVRSRTGLLINIFFVLFTGLYLIFVPENRYAYQLIFFLMLAAAYFTCFLYDLISKKIKLSNTGNF